VSQGQQWTCPSSLSASASSFSPPMMSAESCIRDSYVDAAVQYCWAAECYSRLPASSSASLTPAEAAMQAQGQLQDALSLCSNAPTIGGGDTCDTLAIYPCQ
jgi:hypothetical protein